MWSAHCSDLSSSCHWRLRPFSRGSMGASPTEHWQTILKLRLSPAIVHIDKDHNNPRLYALNLTQKQLLAIGRPNRSAPAEPSLKAGPRLTCSPGDSAPRPIWVYQDATLL